MAVTVSTRYTCALAGAVLLITAPALADFHDGMSAYEEGDYGAALDAWLPLAEGGDLAAMYNVGVLYDHGLGVAENKEAAIRWYREPAEAGNVSAQFSLASIYDYGDGVEEDNAEAVRWYRLAALQADEESQFNLGVMYSNGEGLTI